MSVFLSDKLLNDLIRCKLAANSSSQGVLDTLERGLCLTDSFLCNGCLLGIKLLELFNAHLVIIILVCLISSLEGLDLINGLISITIYLIHTFDHSVQITALDSKLFFKFDIDLLKYDSLPTHLIDLLPNSLVLSHRITVSFISLV